VIGICSVDADQSGPPTGLNQPRSFQILLRSPADLVVIEPPPWWTWERIVWLLSAIACALLLAVAAVMWIARQRLREKGIERARAEAEFTAILAERNRMAREIHDTLAQGLGAISMQLELVKSQISPDSNGAAKHLEQAHELVRHSLTDARKSIWNMRSQVLETGDLASALTGVLQQLADGTGVEGNIHVLGRPRRLPPVTENNLLRIGQEAITNSMKHAHAKQIEVELEFADKEVRLRVNDNGKGFNDVRPPVGESGFGLLGMRERAEQLQARLTIRSNPGRGTEVILIVPVTG
jgi:signal transduction histidine kinase